MDHSVMASFSSEDSNGVPMSSKFWILSLLESRLRSKACLDMMLLLLLSGSSLVLPLPRSSLQLVLRLASRRRLLRLRRWRFEAAASCCRWSCSFSFCCSSCSRFCSLETWRIWISCETTAVATKRPTPVRVALSIAGEDQPGGGKENNDLVMIE